MALLKFNLALLKFNLALLKFNLALLKFNLALAKLNPLYPWSTLAANQPDGTPLPFEESAIRLVIRR